MSDWQKEFAEKQAQDDAVELVVLQGKKAVRCLLIKSDTEGLLAKSGYDLVVQFFSDHSVSLSANLKREISLVDLTAVLRIDEARAMHLPFDRLNKNELYSPGLPSLIKKWKFNEKEGIIASVGPTLLSPSQLKHDLQIGLGLYNFAEACPIQSCLGKKCSWYPYNLARCRIVRKEKIVEATSQQVNQLPFKAKWAELQAPKLSQKLPQNLINKQFSKIGEFTLE